MKREWTSLCLKANRALGAALVAQNLVTFEDQDVAMEQFITAYRDRDWVRASLLRVLLFETQRLDETKLMDRQMEDSSLPAVPLDQYRVRPEIMEQYEADFCAITRTIAFDAVGNTTFLATSYYLSPAVREYWENLLPGPAIWYLTPLGAIDLLLEKRLAEAAEPQEEAEA